MKMEQIRPEEIEKRSFAILSEELERMGVELSKENEAVIKRCIHTTADFDYAKSLVFSPGAVERMKELIRGGAHIVTDTNMALAGISRREAEKYGVQLHCFMAEPSVAAEAKERGLTRAHVSMERAMCLEGPVIFAIGNAPTALLALWEKWKEGAYRPAFVIAVPVGFVNVVSAKECILESDIPHIVNRGRKGGSTVAAAICNAVLYAMRDEAG